MSSATRSKLQRASAILIALTLVLLGRVGEACAHASLIASEPADGVVLAASPDVVILRFNEPVSPLAATIIGPDGTPAAPAIATARNKNVEIRPGSPLQTGTSLVSYRVISADGHPVGGTLSLSVGQPSASAVPEPAAGDRLVRLLIWLTRTGFYVALFAGAGGAFFHVWIDRVVHQPDWSGRLSQALAIAGLPIAALAFGLQGLDALGLPLSGLSGRTVWTTSWTTSYASTMLTGSIALLSAIMTRQVQSEWLARAFSGFGLLSVGLALAVSGHASTAEPQLLTRPAVFLHGLAIAFWAGALAPLLAAAARGRLEFAALLGRFSALAIPVVALLLVSGAALALVQLGDIASLWTTDYGLVLCIKLVAVAGLLKLAALNGFWLTPQIENGDALSAERIRWSIRAEIALMLTIFALAALWRFTPPPRALLQIGAEPARLHIHTAQVMVDVTLTPGRAGPAMANLYFQSGDFGPLIPKEVLLSFSRPETDIEPIERPAEPGPDGLWRSGPFYLPQAGPWIIRVEVLISDFDKAILEDRVEIRR